MRKSGLRGACSLVWVRVFYAFSGQQVRRNPLLQIETRIAESFELAFCLPCPDTQHTTATFIVPRQRTTPPQHIHESMAKGSKSTGGGSRASSGGVAETKQSTPNAFPPAPPANARGDNGGSSSSTSDNPATPTKRSPTTSTPPPYEASAEQLALYEGKEKAGRPCPRCAWPLILNPSKNPNSRPRPACIRWQYGDCAFLGLQIQFSRKFCWVCGVEFNEGDITWVYGEPWFFFVGLLVLYLTKIFVSRPWNI